MSPAARRCEGVATVAALLAALCSSAPTADAATSAGTAAPGALAEARRVMNLSFEDFLAYKSSSYRGDFGFDLASDGCTYPAPTQDYEASCELHDFGYRNFGGSDLRLDPTREAKDFIDRRFHDEARRECEARYPRWNVNGKKIVCQYQADVSYSAVSHRGDGAFFG